MMDRKTTNREWRDVTRGATWRSMAPAIRFLTRLANTWRLSRCAAALSCSMRSRWHMLKRAN